MYVYRIYTEDVDAEGRWIVESLVSDQFEGFSIFYGTGYWRGKAEDCLVVEIVTSGVSADDDQIAVLSICRGIARMNDQESVMMTRQALDTIDFVSAS